MQANLKPSDTGAMFLLFEDQAREMPAPGPAKRPIAVIGAGFSGTAAALQLLRRLPGDQPVVLCERAPDFARGLAYSSADSDHLLNVRASNMSALEEEPLHFEAWLKRNVPDGADGLHRTPAGLFASRGLYGHYIRSMLDSAMRESAGHAQLRLMPDEVIDAEPDPGGYRLHFASGKTLEVCGLVLANGNLPPAESGDPRVCENPWGRKAWAKLSGSLPVLIVGTGLTMVDLAVSMRQRGFRGKIVAMSRGGLLPSRHAPVGAWPTPDFSNEERGSLAALTARVRREIFAASEQGVNWRAVIDSLRPVTPELWRGLPAAERRRFLRHARRYWDVHRHRVAPPHAERLQGMLDDGSLAVLGGRIRSVESGPDGVTVRYSPRGEPGEIRAMSVQRVIQASGLEPVGRTQDRLMQNLIARGLVRLDAHGLGIDTDDDLNLLRPDGTPAPQIWALGPIVRGVFWECVAVPDIRVQAVQVAASVIGWLREDAPRWSFII